MPDNRHALLRKALNHLYNPDYLRNSPLAGPLSVAGNPNTVRLLREKLVNAIEAIKHRSAGTRDENRIFYHDLLYYRYVQKLTQEEMASQLNISLRQFAREQDHAIDLLVMLLTEDYPEFAGVVETAQHAPQAASEAIETGNDFPWFDKTYARQSVNLEMELEIVRELVMPLVGNYQVAIETQIKGPLPRLAVNPVALRQILISVINVLVHQAQGKIIVIEGQDQSPWVRIAVHRKSNQMGRIIETNIEDRANLEIAEKLVKMNNGLIEFQERQDGLLVELNLPVAKGRVVVVVDDNADFHQLIQRYTFGTAYQVVSTQNPAEAQVLAIQHSAQYILLDVMMPEIDGWQILGHLRRHLQTAHIPVIICTIVAQEELAMSLGASAFLRKPVSREMLLDTLDRLTDYGASE
jgi:CheY-like chemotaxis protein